MLILLDRLTRVTAEDTSCLSAACNDNWRKILLPTVLLIKNRGRSFPDVSPGIVYGRFSLQSIRFTTV
ncbi:hypothetical protein ACFL47_06640 [Candidatus Latescibacterota bacterium]